MSARAPHRPLPPTGPAHVPALDGIRAVAVLAVLAFHSGYGWASGGYLGVSVFFTLSGYLITSLLLDEHRRTGTVRLGAFYRRRIGRLLPAALLGLGLAVVAGRAAVVASTDLRGDTLAALGQVANWRFLVDARSYSDLFSGPSPTMHYWSLAIEEQFYLVFPLVVAWALARSALRLRRVLFAGLLGSWALLIALVAGGWSDTAYYATPSRLGELLIGALLGCVASPAALAARPRRAARLAGPATAVLAVLVVTVDVSGRWTYAWVFPLVSVLTVLVIVGAASGGRVGRALGAAPLVGLGLISYGVYVYHWPVFLLLTPERTGIAQQHGLTALRLAVTLVLAVASYRLVEMPIRRAARAERPARSRRAAWSLVASWGVAAALLVVAARPEAPANDFTAIAAALDAPPVTITARQDTDTAARTAVPPVPVEQPMVAFFGDSTAAVTSLALARWGEPSVDHIGVTGAVVPLGCGLQLPGERRMQGYAGPIEAECYESAAGWAAELDASGARVAVIQSGVWETTDHRLPDEQVWRHLGDPVLDEAYRQRFLHAVDTLLGAGADRVVWLTSPVLRTGRAQVNASELPEADPARMARYNELVRSVAAVRPEVVVVDLADRVARWSPAEDGERRPDGVHLSDAAALRLVEEWLGPELLTVFADLGVAPPDPDQSNPPRRL